MPPHFVILRIPGLPNLYLPVFGLIMLFFCIAIFLTPVLVVIWLVMALAGRKPKWLKTVLGVFVYVFKLTAASNGTSVTFRQGSLTEFSINLL